VEALIEETFVPNGIHFSDPGMKVVILTGPNMGGKSCFARQVALIVIMAQIGSFVPATKAILSPLDAVFTRSFSLFYISFQQLKVFGKVHSFGSVWM
jgi:DNA mismatch repair ATPase MutS